jgi:hypothetical protein
LPQRAAEGRKRHARKDAALSRMVGSKVARDVNKVATFAYVLACHLNLRIPIPLSLTTHMIIVSLALLRLITESTTIFKGLISHFVTYYLIYKVMGFNMPSIEI